MEYYFRSFSSRKTRCNNSGTLYIEVCGPPVDYYYRKVGLFVLRCAGLRARSRLWLTHTFVMQRSGEQVPAVSTPTETIS